MQGSGWVPGDVCKGDGTSFVTRFPGGFVMVDAGFDFRQVKSVCSLVAILSFSIITKECKVIIYRSTINKEYIGFVGDQWSRIKLLQSIAATASPRAFESDLIRQIKLN
jgi:hypothetical protein